MLKELTPADLHWLLTHSREKKIPLGEKIIIEGEALKEIYIILSGLFSIESKNSDQRMIVSKGEIIGVAFFLIGTGTLANISVSAIESNCKVRAIPVEPLSSHLKNDSDFALRFYRMAARILSERSQKLVKTFFPKTTQKTTDKTAPIHGPVPLIAENKPNFDLIKHLLESCTPLPTIFKNMQEGKIDDALKQREKKLSAATLSAKTIYLLWKISKKEGIHDLENRIIYHEPSVKAEDKQSLIFDSHVQKTVTILIGNKFILCSSIGILKIERKLLRKIASKLDIPRSEFNIYLNPSIFVPEIELGLLRGIVSTFFSPNRITQLSIVALIIPSSFPDKDIAISLSPFESLLIPSALFPKIVKKYAKLAYPYIPFVELNV